MTIPPTDDALEADVRAMLQRRAGDVPDRPGAALPTGVARAETGSARPRRPLLAAVAAAVVLLLGIGVAAVRSGDGDEGGQTVVATAPDDADTPSTERRSTPSTLPETSDPTVTTEQPGPTSAVPGASTSTGPSGPGATDPSGATGPAAPVPTITLVTLEHTATRWRQRRCDGSEVVMNGPALLRLDRTGPSGSPLTIRVAASGTVAPPRPDSVTFPEGESSVVFSVGLPDRGAVDLRVDILPGDGYLIGDASGWRHTEPDPPLKVDCLRPVAVDPTGGSATQTIRAGQRPEDIRFIHEMSDLLSPSVVGDLPPGLSIRADRGIALRWEGSVATSGTFAFDVRLCLGPDLCDGTARVTITVLPA